MGVLMRLILASLLLSGCVTTQPEVFILPDGQSIVCLQYEQEECGMALRKCGENHSVDFECLNRAKYIGQGPATAEDLAPEKEEGKK